MNIKKYKENKKEIDLIFKDLEKYIFSLGSNIIKKKNFKHISYIHNKEFLSLMKNNYRLAIYLDLDPSSFKNKKYIRDLTNVAHLGIGNLGFIIKNKKDLQRSKKYIKKSYDLN